MKVVLTPLIPEKSWIVSADDERIGMLTKVAAGYKFAGSDGTIETFENNPFVEDIGGVEETRTTHHDRFVMGYPINHDAPYDVQLIDNIPTYTKMESSDIRFAAGWYSFPDTVPPHVKWCPKMQTLNDHKFYGPFKQQSDAKFSINL